MARRALLPLGLLLTLATCRDGIGPRLYSARVAVAPIFPSDARLAAFGLSIDRVQFVVVRRVAPDTLADTTVGLPPDARTLDLRLRVRIVSSPETLLVSIVALAGAVPLFQGSAPVEVASGVVSQPTDVPVTTYVGPGAGVDSIAILPRIPFIFFGDSLRFQVLAFQARAPVPQFYVSWKTSDTTLAHINGIGSLRAPLSRSNVWVIARTPGGGAIADSVKATFQPIPTQLVVVGGAGQSGTVGLPLLLPLEVEVRAADNLPVGGVAVRFRSPSGIGGVTDSVVVTDAAGRARTTATLGNVVGGQSFQASVAGLGGSPVTFATVAFAGTATQLVAIAGNLQSAVVGTAVAIDPAVHAQDQFGNPVPGASITFATKGAGSVTGPAQLTNGAGVATVGRWMLGTAIGTDTLTATLSGLTPVTFTAKGIAGVATQIAQLAGNGQTAVVNTILPVAPAVTVRDQFNNPVSGVGVLFATASGSGSVTGGSAVTDTAGVARVGGWQLGTLVGQNTLTASTSGLTGSPVTFTASGARDVAARLLRVSIDTQTSIAGQPVSTPPVVRVVDQYGNAIPGASVTFTLTGAFLGTVTPPTATTDSSGIARVTGWTLAVSPGLNALDATAAGLVGSPMTFSATGIVTTATNMALSGGDGQSGIVGAVLPTAYSVVVTNGITPVQGVPVHWAAGPAGGSMNPATSVTDVNGIANSMRTLGTVARTDTATAAVGGLIGSPVRFRATTLPGAATQLIKQSVDPQTGTVATAVAAPVVKVADQFGNAVSGVIVDFVAAGGGALGATKSTSDTAGLATAGSWTLGSLVGTNTVTVTAGALAAKTFTANSVAGPPARLAFVREPTHGLAGNPIDTVQVAIQDQYGNLAVPAKDLVSLRLVPTPNQAKLQGIVDVAAVNGVASFPNLTLDPAGIGYTLVDSSGSLTRGGSKPFDIGGVIAAVPVNQGPVAAAVNPTTGRVYVPAPVAAAVAVVDGTNFKALPSILGLELPADAAVNAVTDTIFASTAMGVVPIDGARNVAGAPILVGTSPQGVAVDEKANRVYVAVAADLAKGSPALVVIDGSRDAVIGSVPLDGAGQGVAFDAASGRVFVAIPGLNELAIVDPIKLSVVTRLVGASPHGVAAGNGIVYVTNNNPANYVFVLDAFTLEEKARVPVGKLPEGIDVDPTRGIVYVANAGEPTLSLIETGKFTVFATLQVAPAGFAPKDAAVDRRTGLVYVPSTDNQLRVVRP